MDYELCLLRAPDAAPRSSGAGCGIPINPLSPPELGQLQRRLEQVYENNKSEVAV